MVDYNYGVDLQMTLLINGLRPEIKSAVMQHLPFQDIEAFVDKARHVESALTSQSALSFANAACVDGAPLLKPNLKNLDSSLQELSSKFDTLLKEVKSKMDKSAPRPQWQRAPWQPQPSRNRSSGSKFQSQPTTPWKGNSKGGQNIVCWKCGKQGHIQRECHRGLYTGYGKQGRGDRELRP